MPSPGRTIKVPSIQDLPENLDPVLREVLEQIVNALDVREGRVAKGTNSRFTTIQDLVTAGVVADGVLK